MARNGRPHTEGPTDIYIDFDKNSAQLARGRDVKVLQRVLEGLYPSIPFRMARADGVISAKGRPVVMVEPKPESQSNIRWQPAIATELGISREEVAKAFREARPAARAQPTEHWV